MIASLSVAKDIDPNYANALKKAVKNKLNILAMIVNFLKRNRSQ